MDEQQSHRQIQQMVNFILNEAKDKAEEIDAKTLEEFNVERLKYVQGGKEKIRSEFKTKMKKQETALAIARSAAINRSRLEKVEARQASLQVLRETCTKEIRNLTQDRNRYANLCADLIVQGCLKLMEDQVAVRCKREDEQSVRAALDMAARKYSDVVKRECNVSKAVQLAISPDYLPSSSGGGVVLTCLNATISIDNTLDTRLGLVMDNDLPSLRRMLFPSR